MVFSFFTLFLFIIIAYNGTFSISAIVATSTTLLTVEGFLLALSPLVHDKKATVTVGIVAILSSLMSIEVAQAMSSLQALYPEQHYTVTTPFLLGISSFQYFTITVVMFVSMLDVYWGSIWGNKKREWWKNSERGMY